MEKIAYINPKITYNGQSRQADSTREGKELAGTLAAALPEGWLLSRLAAKDNEALVEVIAKKDARLPAESLDYAEYLFFQNEGKCGYSSSYGWGSEIRELKKGSLDELMRTQATDPEPNPMWRFFREAYKAVTEKGYTLDRLTIHQFVRDDYCYR